MTVVNFCQPEGCIILNAKKVGKKETAYFIFTLTDKDSGKRIFYADKINLGLEKRREDNLRLK